ncbi:MAG: glycine/sarcosine/betaine reductase selenoprotein B family protein [Acidimicrobiales bacterium]
MTPEDPEPASTESVEELRKSFWYGTRSNLDFKFLKDLGDSEFGQFLAELLGAVAAATDDGDVDRVVDTAYRWQLHAYSGHLGDPDDFPHRFDDTPFAPMASPLSDSRLALMTSSGHFVAGDDPEPFGVIDMSQEEAEARIGEFLASPPELSAIPVHTPAAKLRVRHGGYPTRAVAADHQVALPIGHLRTLEAEGVIGELAETAYSFVGATSQVRLKKEVAPAWATRLRDEGVDAVLLVPV